MHVAIVGSGVAGVTAARTIRENDPKANISIYTDEKHLYYPRPRLYEVLSGEAKPREIYMFSEQWYEKRGIKVHLNKKVVGIETAKKHLLLENGSRVNYDRLLLANGAHPFVPPIKGVEKTGVFTLRSIKDALAVKEYTKKRKEAIIIGGGLLGLEFAASLRKVGQQVEVVEIFPRLLPRQLDQDGAMILKDRIETRGIKIVLGVKTEEILGKETVSGILLDNGKELSGGLVLISAGVRPNTDLAAEAGIKVEKGVVVDQYLQTSVNDVYATGDVAEFDGRVYGIIPAAMEQAKISATNMLEKEKQVYKGTIPSNTLKIVGIDLTSMGLVNPEGPQYEEIKKIDKEKGVYKKIVLQQGRIVGAIILGDRKGVTPIKKLMDQQVEVTKYKDFLLEDNFDYRKILLRAQKLG
ncbi:NAD(P)/FAD-dependent oxidoreductase [Candidatus Bathyarchaeota archaeon]|nr:NAD(P)/FAD-dependent oxidoreductase [Candidatus Bathyarchaeota archaeon]